MNKAQTPEQRPHNRAPQIERRGTEGTTECHVIGYAAVFYREGDAGTQYELWENTYERIMPGAFANLAKNDVRGLFNHDRGRVLGRVASGTMTLTVDNVGLRYDITLADTEADRDLALKIERGDIDGSSFAFVSTEVMWREERVDGARVEYRELLACDVYDVGPVTYPAYAATSTDVARRSLDEWHTDRQTDQQARRRRHRQTEAARARGQNERDQRTAGRVF